MSLKILVDNASCSPNVPGTAKFQLWIRRALGEDRNGEIGIRIVDAAESGALNDRYRGRAQPTNVLAFPAEPILPDIGDETPLGDLVICAPVIEREAQEQRIGSEAHWAHIAIHGALHLLGFDHDTTDAALEMESEETRILASLGFSDPYRPR